MQTIFWTNFQNQSSIIHSLELNKSVRQFNFASSMDKMNRDWTLQRKPLKCWSFQFFKSSLEKEDKKTFIILTYIDYFMQE